MTEAKRGSRTDTKIAGSLEGSRRGEIATKNTKRHNGENRGKEECSNKNWEVVQE